jgi:alpha-glucosidase
MTWCGAPTIYYGDEVGLTGWTDPDNRRPYPWGHENTDILSYYKVMIAIHKKYKVIATGSLDYLYLENGLLCYGRWNSEEKLVVLVNNNDTARTVEVPIWRLAVFNGSTMYRIIMSMAQGYDDTVEKYHVKNSVITVSVPSKTAMVLANIIK